jgi:UDP-glucose 4-epimerase
VTGGMGYIGSHTIVEILSASDKCGFDKIVILDNLSNSNAGVLDKILTISGKKIDEDIVFEECDLRDKETMKKIFINHSPIVSVIHFAGLKAVGESCSKPLEYYDNNVGGSFILF